MIVQKEDPILREKAEPVNPKDFSSPRLKKILGDMVTAMEKELDGVAIAAPQIGIPLRIFIVSHRAFEYADDEEDEDDRNELDSLHTHDSPKIKRSNMVFINPVIIKLSRKKVWMPEGCLSVRWLYGEVSRAEKATVRAYDENGKVFTWGGSGLLAQIFQHETDHLNGTLFIDSARNVEKITAEEQKIRLEGARNNHE
ncbi:MAG: Peptide deformylase [Parcubacteria group bacterium GW2011_GWC1_42_11]|uniref:Peptide deformylase n=1 Tax=Candidatus Nomurabacteria bacterium GW2011_GWC2_42_20 TaxID=1618756 RepID=A0A0G0ZFY5_9BACT|nr:MAG: Peptide deformylase [Parcubacteria group bacterium GW2011_GWC1_42_11]KKS47612.1 MAG: Peptide deformylase [Candidatus Nomurabacteria bacterium GW2011_GWC2_42_20]KKT08170.1 MAG: Peptide deformylase [Candidatus Nomurabacteria bacterium GW2011_GWB1_43_20]